MTDLPKIAVVIPTRDRPADLANLLSTVIDQGYPPSEIVVVDDSPARPAKEVLSRFSSRLKKIDCAMKYIEGSCEGLTVARNQAVDAFSSEAVLFLDDDVLLEHNVLEELASFLRTNPVAIGIQPDIERSSAKPNTNVLEKLRDATYKALMLNFHEKNRLAVRRSGQSVFPTVLTKTISAQRLSGCSCWRREVFATQKFDTQLKRWSFMEDLDFSYRVYKKHPKSLFATPRAVLVHRASRKARMENATAIHMSTIYWFYIFFKDFFESSILNLLAFLLAVAGSPIAEIGSLVMGRKPRTEWWNLIYLVESHLAALRNLRSIVRRDLGFFNSRLWD